jgi:uncharacterized BrkB/YihY/UPF0761 family membrane protein
VAAAAEAARGRHADRPQEIPSRGWLDIAKRVKNQIKRDRLSIVAAGVATACSRSFRGWSRLSALRPSRRAGAGRAACERDQPHAAAAGGRPVARAAARPCDGVIAVVIAIALIVGVPAFLKLISLGAILETVLSFVRWPVLALLAILGFAVLYRYGPSRAKPRWRWVTWGAAIAVALWIIGAALFSVYVTRFGNYSETYGAAGAVVILLMWFLLSSYAVLIGAEINGETARQTRKDTTSGRDRPMGARRAYAADTVAEGST